MQSNFHAQGTHIVSTHCALLILASWLVVELAFSRVHHAALATHALKDIPLAPFGLGSLALPSRESSTFSIVHVICVNQRLQVLKNTFLNGQP